MTTEEIRIMFCEDINETLTTPCENWWTRCLMYCLAMAYINGDYPEYVKTIWGVGKRVNAQ